jgi:serine/threonine protein phosphatase PrpC
LIDDVIRIKGIELTLQRYNAGYYADIGTRRVMEDGYAILQDLQVSRLPVSCFAILDGHNGD